MALSTDFASDLTTTGLLPATGMLLSTLENAGDSDWFKVALLADQYYYFTVAGKPYYADLALRGGDGAVLQSGQATGNGALLSYKAAASGDYFVEVKNRAGQDEPVGYTLRSATSIDATGDTHATAHAAALGETVAGRIDGRQDLDTFSFNLEAGVTYTVAASWVANAPAHLMGRLDFDGPGGIYFGYGQTVISPQISFTALASGLHYIVARQYAIAAPPLDYTLALSAAADDFSAGMATTGKIAASGTASGKLDNGADKDWFAIALKAGVTYFFKLGSADTTAPLLSLHDSNGKGMVSATGAGPSSGSMQYTPTASGTFYLEVLDEKGGSGAYSILALDLTNDKAGPAVLSMSPAGGAAGVGMGGNIVLHFDEQIERGKGAISLLGSDGSVVQAFGWSDGVDVSGTTLTIDPAALLRPATSYRVVLASGSVQDLAGNPYAGASMDFSTQAVAAAGGNGHDTLLGLRAEHRLDGGAGIDTVVYASSRANYQLTRGDAETTVGSPGGIASDTLSNVERLLFRDTSVALDIDGTGGQAYRMYQAALNRAPDKAGLGYWMQQLDQGARLASVADAFITSAEFQRLYGAASSDADFVKTLYANVLHRAPDQAGLDFWVDGMRIGASRAEVLTGFSESAENQAAALALIGNGFEYTPYG